MTPTHGFFRLLKKRGVLRRVYSQNIDGMEGSSSGLGRVALEGVAICGMGRGDKGGKGKGKQIEGEYVMLHGSVHAVRCTVCEWVGEWSREHGDAFGTGDTPSCPDCEERGASYFSYQHRHAHKVVLQPTSDAVLASDSSHHAPTFAPLSSSTTRPPLPPRRSAASPSTTSPHSPTSSSSWVRASRFPGSRSSSRSSPKLRRREEGSASLSTATRSGAKNGTMSLTTKVSLQRRVSSTRTDEGAQSLASATISSIALWATGKGRGRRTGRRRRRLSSR